MGKGKKELKRFESVAFIMLEVLDRAIKLKSLQLDELKMKQQKESPKKYPLGGFVDGKKGNDEFVINKKDYPKLLKKVNIDEVKMMPNGGFPWKDLFPEQFETEEEKKSREEWISRGEKMSQFILADYGNQNCGCPVCVAERNAKNNDEA